MASWMLASTCSNVELSTKHPGRIVHSLRYPTSSTLLIWLGVAYVSVTSSAIVLLYSLEHSADGEATVDAVDGLAQQGRYG